MCSKGEIIYCVHRYVHTTYIYRFVYHIRSMYVSCIYMCSMFDQINRTWYPQQCGSATTKMKTNRSNKCTEWTEGVVLCNPKSDRCCEVISASMGCVGRRLLQKPAWCDGHTLTLAWLPATICVRATARSRINFENFDQPIWTNSKRNNGCVRSLHKLIWSVSGIFSERFGI